MTGKLTRDKLTNVAGFGREGGGEEMAYWCESCQDFLVPCDCGDPLRKAVHCPWCANDLDMDKPELKEANDG